MTIKQKRSEKIKIFVRFLFMPSGYKKADYLKKRNIFGKFGENNFWFPRIIPADPEMVKIHNNVKVATDVYFCTHDVVHNLFNDDVSLPGGYQRYTAEIEIFDNVFIGARATIMYGVKIGPNAIIAANSVIVKDVPEGTVVGGNPAKVIGSYDKVADKRYNYSMESLKNEKCRNRDTEGNNNGFCRN